MYAGMCIIMCVTELIYYFVSEIFLMNCDSSGEDIIMVYLIDIAADAPLNSENE